MNTNPFTTSIRRAFSMTELMIAVAVLIVVIIATSRIFGTASKITGLGNASASVMTEAATIERLMREDIARLTTEGFFAIRCVAVQNDIWQTLPPPWGNPSAPLLNPNLAKQAIVRADQLVFFATGVEGVSAPRFGSGTNAKGQSTASRIYYGHAFQLRNGLPAEPGASINMWNAHDPGHGTNMNGTGWSLRSITGTGIPGTAYAPISPWYYGPINMVRTNFQQISGNQQGTNIYQRTSIAASMNGNQPPARQWLLARQAVGLMDDDDNPRHTNSKTAYLGPAGTLITARGIFHDSFPDNGTPTSAQGWSREIRNGRMDAAATQLDDIRRWVTIANEFNGIPRPWVSASDASWSNANSLPADQRRVIASALYYPRAERHAPSQNRVDQALTNHVIGSACSSLTIDWTYDDGVGAATDAAGTFYRGIGIPPDAEQPWFGMTDPARGVYPLAFWPWTSVIGQYGGAAHSADTIMPLVSGQPFPNAIETDLAPGSGRVPTLPPGVTDYWAIFGYNQSQPFLFNGQASSSFGVPDVNAGFTPFPSAIRVTMVLHDPEGRLEGGREFQFVIRLPRRVP